MKFINGERSLPVSYWLYGSVLGAVISVTADGAIDVMAARGAPAWAFFAVLAMLTCYVIWWSIGCWRSATNQQEAGRSLGGLAKFMIGFGMFGFFAGAIGGIIEGAS